MGTGGPVAAATAAAARDAGGRTRTLRVLTVVDGYFPSLGGTEMQAALLSRELASRGVRVEIMAPRLLPRQALETDLHGVPLHRIPYPRIRGIGAAILGLRFAACLLRRRHDFDAIHVHTVSNLAAVAGVLRPWLGATLVAKVSGAWEFEGGLLDPALRTRWLHRLMNAAMRRYDAIQTISDYTRERLLAAGYAEDRLAMIPNAVDLERFSNARRGPGDGGPLRVLYAGRLDRVKGVDVLLRAWRELDDQGGLPAGTELQLAGDGPDRDSLERLARVLGVDGSVRFLGGRDDVPELMAGADVYVQPSRQEGLPNAVLEAMCSGLPVVATRVSGSVELVRDGWNGLLVASERPADLAAAVGRLLAAKRLRRQMGARSREIIESTYQVPVVLGALTRLYGSRRRR
ncbi:MAG TPA: glycosyltransferase family 4 protein [Gammaproteobacteria bacterium]|nr:glycosyltransferase family 4 protein [Gammaproteobacteria bacterium]